jgi:NTE family protein
MDKNLALVLGGGGAAGHAWLIGLMAGLAEAGVDLAGTADVVIGTSAGATAAAQVLSRSPDELLAQVLAEAERPAGQPRPPPARPASLPMAAVFERMRAISAAAGSADELQRAMGTFGLECDAVLGPEAGQARRALVAARLPSADWPERRMVVVAVDALTGEVVRFDRDSGIELADAITAATALPGMVPTHPIAGKRYINAGVRSPDNADLAAGHKTVVVLTPFSGRSGPVPEGQFEGLARPPGADLDSQVRRLRAQGSRVEVLRPDEASRAAMGTDQMDLATRAPSARAGFEQGRREAGRLGLA